MSVDPRMRSFAHCLIADDKLEAANLCVSVTLSTTHTVMPVSTSNVQSGMSEIIGTIAEG